MNDKPYFTKSRVQTFFTKGVTGPIRYMENGFQNVNYSIRDFLYCRTVFSVHSVGDTGNWFQAIKRTLCFYNTYSQRKLFWVFLFTVLYIKAVILAGFHKTIKEEWAFVTEISSHLVAW